MVLADVRDSLEKPSNSLACFQCVGYCSQQEGNGVFCSNFYAILLEAIEKYVAWKLEESRRFGFIGAAFSECLKDYFPFYLFETYASIRQHDAEFLRLKGAWLDPIGVKKVKMTPHDHVVIFQQDYPFNTVAQFAYVAGPRMGNQKLFGLGIEAAKLFTVLVVELLHKYTGKLQDVLSPLAQRGQVDFDRCESEVEIFTKA